MRDAVQKQWNIAAAVAIAALLLVLSFVFSCEAFADDGLKDRHAQLTYGYTECTGEVHEASNEQIISSGSEGCFALTMMLCDTDHVLHIEGDGITADNVTFTSSNPDVLDIDNEGHATLNKAGTARITATVAADEEYAETNLYLDVRVDRHEGWLGGGPRYVDRPAAWALDIGTNDGPHQLAIDLRPGASATFASENIHVAYVDQYGMLTPVAEGTTHIRIEVDDGGGRYKACSFSWTVKVSGETILLDQEITGITEDHIHIDWHDGLQLKLQAKTDIEYKFGISTVDASVDQNGFMTVSGPGSVCVIAQAKAGNGYKPAVRIFYVIAHDYAAEEAERIAAEEEAARKAEEEARKAAEEQAAKEAALKAEIAKAQSLKRPTLKVKALKKKKIKLTWGKVENADGYIVYVKIPGKKKYVKAVTRNATVKSVTHKGLSKGRVYKYKVRAFKKVNGKVYYSPYSKVRKAKVK